MKNENSSTMGRAGDLLGECIAESKKLWQFLKMVPFIEVNSSSSRPYIFQVLQEASKTTPNSKYDFL